LRVASEIRNLTSRMNTAVRSACSDHINFFLNQLQQGFFDFTLDASAVRLTLPSYKISTVVFEN
jgi:hypothetical protein